MLIRAAQEHNIELSKAYFIGDVPTDIEAGQRAGATTFLVLTGLGHESYYHYIRRTDQNGYRPEKIFTNLYAATRWLLKNDS